MAVESSITGAELCPVCDRKLYPYYPLMLNSGNVVARGKTVCSRDCYDAVWESYMKEDHDFG